MSAGMGGYPPQISSQVHGGSMFPSQRDPSADHQAQLEFFHKLGYSTAQVLAVQLQFGPNTDTDKVLGELVRLGAGQEALVSRGNRQTPAPDPHPHPHPPAAGGEEPSQEEDALRPVVLDGSNVAMSHGNKEVFSCLGIQLAVNFFLERGHTDITVFVPLWRKEQPRPDVPITDQHILRELERRKILVFTPSRRVAGKRVVCNDDWFIVKLAYESDGVIVSNDMYRDLHGKEPEWKRFIEERLLMYSFVNDKFMPPDDPLGRHGPTLENFLRKFPKTQKKPLCPYGKKCTYGNKCKFHHPERANRSHQSGGEQAKLPWTPQRQPGQSLSLVEDMAKKLTLAPESGSCKATKEHKNDHVTPLKGSQRSGKRSASRRPSPSDHSCGSQDSGLGSIDSQPVEAPWSSPQHGQQYCPPRRAPCRCCSHGPFSDGTPPASYLQQYDCGGVSSHRSDGSAYGPGLYSSYGGYRHTYGPQSDFQQRQHWSDPFGFQPLPVQNLPGDPFHWGPPQAEQQITPGGLREREAVRKKLLAIFSAHLVDAAMNMFPELMDAELLVAEVLRLQSQSRSLR